MAVPVEVELRSSAGVDAAEVAVTDRGVAAVNLLVELVPDRGCRGCFAVGTTGAAWLFCCMACLPR